MQAEKQKELLNDEELLKLEEEFVESYLKNDRRPLRLLLSLYKGYYGKLLLSALFYIIKHSPVWVLPVVIANVVDLVIKQPAGFENAIIINVGIEFGLIMLNVPFHYLHIKFQSIAMRSIEAGLRGAMVRKLQQCSISFYKEMQSGRIQSKVIRDVQAVQDLSSQVFSSIISVIINLVIALSVVLTKNLTVFFFFLVCGPVSAFCAGLFRKKIQMRNRDFRRKMEETSAQVSDMVEMIPVTKAHALEKQEVSRLTMTLNHAATLGYRLDIIQSYFGSVMWVVFQLFQLVCLSFSIYMAVKGKISVGDITLYQTYFSNLVGQISALIMLVPTISRGTESLSSIGEILSSTKVENDKGKKISGLRGEYSFKDVCFRYEDGEKNVLNGINLDIKKGETIAFVGESGAGKTTLLNMIIGFDFPTGGKLTVDGNDITGLNLKSYRRHIAVVPQNTILFSGTVRENITYGMSSVNEERLRVILDAARLTEVVAALPNGLDTKIGEHGDKLSGGQRQRISIARAIIRNPDVIVLDEATSALDSVSERLIQEALEHLTKGKTTFIVAHRLSTIKNADRIAVINGGICTEFGTYDELMALKGEFYEYRMLQQ